jgi:hypothetical protein
MFAFLTSIRHPQTANDYHKVLELLSFTIESVLGQNTDQDFILVVVCNVIPKALCNDERVIFVQVDFPPADQGIGESVAMEALKIDKGAKISAGLLFLKRYHPDYVYVIDADDWVNRNTVSYITSKNSNVFYANAGYVVDFDSRTYLKKYGSYRYCGSTYVYNYNTLMSISGLASLNYKEHLKVEDIIKKIDNFFLKEILGHHRRQLAYFQKINIQCKLIKIPIISWVKNNGQNHSGYYDNIEGIPISKYLFEIFSIKIECNKKTTPFSLIKYFCVAALSFLGWQISKRNKDYL